MKTKPIFFIHKINEMKLIYICLCCAIGCSGFSPITSNPSPQNSYIAEQTVANSMDGTAISGGTGTLQTSAGTWTFGNAESRYPGNWDILLNGEQAAGGIGSRLEVANGGQLYALGTDDQWYVWRNDTWPNSAAPPTSTPTPTPTAAPTPATPSFTLTGASISPPTASSGQSASVNVAITITPPTEFTSSGPIRLPGVNLAGGAFGSTVPGVYGTDYIYPSTQEIDYFASKGMKVFRLSFLIERLQTSPSGPLRTSDLNMIDSLVQYAQSKGMMVDLDPHNFGYIFNQLVGVDSGSTANLVNFWTQLASHYVNQPNVIFSLMNEPNAQSPQQWHDAAIQVVNAIRGTGANQMILVGGAAWDNGWTWVSSGNASVWQGFQDTNFAFEAHVYLDSDGSGTHAACTSGAGSSRLVAITNWAQSNGYKLFLGETGWSNDPSCPPEAQAEFNYMTQNSSTWFGYAYWAAGPWWGPYMYTIEPTGLGTSNVQDQPQMSILTSHL